MMIFLKKHGFWILAGILLLALFGKYLYLKPRFVQGEVAPVFSGTLVDGSAFSLDDLTGNYILLDFWGSWCGPCRQASPSLVKIYREFARPARGGQPGFQIVSVGVESNPTRWKQAILQDQLEWPWHLTDTDMFNGEIAQLYGVKAIPTTYLIDPDRMIIGVNLPEDQLRKVLSERLLTN